jgi:RNA polymerase sigma-70 factor (ECF subfamily)
VSRIERLLARVPEDIRSELVVVPGLAEWIDACWTDATTAWPGLALGADDFLPYLGERASASWRAGDALPHVRAADLYLACACARGHAAALAALDQRYLPAMDAALGKRSLAHLRDEVKQRVRTKLLVGDGAGGAPRIAEYAGRGDLASWLQAVAVRIALNMVRDDRRDVELVDDDAAAAPASGDSPELRLIKERGGAALVEAFTEAFAGLTARQRNLLRQHFLDGLGIDELGTAYRVHRATAARWLAKARATLVGRTRRLLADRLQLRAGELDSFGRYIDSQVELVLRKTSI